MTAKIIGICRSLKTDQELIKSDLIPHFVLKQITTEFAGNESVIDSLNLEFASFFTIVFARSIWESAPLNT